MFSSHATETAPAWRRRGRCSAKSWKPKLPACVGSYFGRLAGDRDGDARETAGRGVATGDFGGGVALGLAGEAPAVGEGTGSFFAMSDARSLSNWSIVALGTRYGQIPSFCSVASLSVSCFFLVCASI
jgi:hypothetical protein